MHGDTARWSSLVALGLLLAGGMSAFAQPPAEPLQRTAHLDTVNRVAPRAPLPKLTLGELPPELGPHVGPILEKASFRSAGPEETFRCRPATYYWLLENPDQTAALWRAMGATCADIRRREGGLFAWQDGKGSELVWRTVYRSQDRHLWYAVGKVRPGALLPAVPVKALVAVAHNEVQDRLGRPAVRHQMELIVQTNSRALTLASRILGASAPRLAEQYVGQIEMFFAALAWYLDQNPEKAAKLFAQIQTEDRTAPR